MIRDLITIISRQFLRWRRWEVFFYNHLKFHFWVLIFLLIWFSSCHTSQAKRQRRSSALIFHIFVCHFKHREIVKKLLDCHAWQLFKRRAQPFYTRKIGGESTRVLKELKLKIRLSQLKVTFVDMSLPSHLTFIFMGIKIS
jgi:hypothetical protein